MHPRFDDVVRSAKSAGIPGVHLRTELLCDRGMLDRLLACGVDVISVDLNADRAATYQAMMGIDRFKDVLINIDYLLQHRRRLTAQAGTSAFALPWIVPHLQRRVETFEDIDTFFERWQHTLGTAVIDGPPPFDTSDSLTPALTPARVTERDRGQCMTIFCDGSVPIDEWDWPCNHSAGNIAHGSLRDLWRVVREQRNRPIATGNEVAR